jgi:RNA polymerase sigma factor (sigma-70 family)
MSLTASPAPETAAPARRPHVGALSKSALRHASDDRLVALTRAGSERAFAEIMRRYQRPLQFYCLHMVGGPRAEDAVQQAFMQAFVALRDGDRREIALRPWLYRITRNCAIDLLRKQPFEHDELDPEFDGTAQPPGVVEQKEELARIVAAIQALPERQRRALTLRELEGKSYGEISAELGHTDSGVRQLIFRARTALRNLGAIFLPVGSIRWRLLGSPSAGADPHQIVAAASVSPGGSNVVQAAASVFVATLALMGAGAPASVRHGEREAMPAGLFAAAASGVRFARPPAGGHGRRAPGAHRAVAASGEDGGSGAFAPAAVAADQTAPPAESTALAAGGDQASGRTVPETESSEEPQKLETLDASPDSSTAPATNEGTIGESGPAVEPSGAPGSAPAQDSPPGDQSEEGTAPSKPTAPKVPAPPKVIPPKRPVVKKPTPPRPPASPRSPFGTAPS